MEHRSNTLLDLMSELKEVEYDIHMTKRSEVLLRSSLRHDMFSLLCTNFDLFEEQHIPILIKYVEYAQLWIEDEIADESAEELNHLVSNYVELAKQFLVSFDELVRRKEDTDRSADRSADADRFADRSADCPHIRTSDDWIDIDPERSVRIVICDDCGVTLTTLTVDPNRCIETKREEQDLFVREHLEIRCNCPAFLRTTKIGCNVCPPNPKWEQHLLTDCPLCISSGGTSDAHVKK